MTPMNPDPTPFTIQAADPILADSSPVIKHHRPNSIQLAYLS